MRNLTAAQFLASSVKVVAINVVTLIGLIPRRRRILSVIIVALSTYLTGRATKILAIGIIGISRIKHSPERCDTSRHPAAVHHEKPCRG